MASIRLNLKLLSSAKRCVAGGQMLIVAGRPQDGKARLSPDGRAGLDPLGPEQDADLVDKVAAIAAAVPFRPENK